MKSTDCKHGLRKTDCAACTPGGALAYQPEPQPKGYVAASQPEPPRVNREPAASARDKRTNPELILDAARQLAQPFSLEDLIVYAWSSHPAALGLRGWSQSYPDSNRVLACIWGRRGLVARGLLVRQGKLFTAKEGPCE